MCVQIKFPVSSVVTRTTHQFRRVWEGFLMHSFLVGPQVTFRCRIISATSITNFDITIKAVLFLMCCPCVVFQFRFALEYLVTVVARDLHLSVDTQHVEVQGVFCYELLSTDIANKFINHFDEI